MTPDPASITSQSTAGWGRHVARWPFAALFLLLVAVYASSATWSVDQNVDALAAAVPGWVLVETGSLNLDDFAGANPWFVDGPTGVVSNRPPGVIGVAALAYLAADPFTDAFTGWPATAAAVLATAAAVTIVAIVVAEMHGARHAIVAAIALGLGAATWPVSSGQLWPHGIDQLWLALGMLSAWRGRVGWSGLWLGAAILTRPPILIVAGVFWMWVLLDKGWSRYLARASVGPFLGVGLLAVYNSLVFGRLSLIGGYDSVVSGGGQYRSPTGYMSNLIGTFFSPSNGLLTWSPWLIPLLVMIPFACQRAPKVARTFALGGLAYLLAHTALNRYWGGLPFNYRYAIEPITLAVPFLAGSTPRLWSRPILRLALVFTLAVSVLVQAADAYLTECSGDPPELQCTVLG